MERRTVPAFASFKPRAPPTVPSTQLDRRDEARNNSSNQARRDRDGRREPDRDSNSNARRHNSHRDYKDRRHPRDHSRHERHRERRQRTATPPPVEDGPEESECFMIDRRGDVKNVEYGGLHRYSIPSYHRIGYGKVLGADKFARIDRDASTEKGIVLRVDRGKGSARAERLLTRKRTKGDDRSQRLIVAQVEDAEVSSNLEADFMALRPSLKQKRGSDSPPLGAPDVDYRSVEGKARPDSRPKDEDVEFESSFDDDRDHVASDIKIRARNAELSRTAKTNPTNTDAWLALIEHQVHHAFPSIDPDDLTSSQRRSVAEICLSVLDQAFKHISKGNPGHDRILLVYINEGSKIWKTPKLASKWKDVLRQHPDSMLLWREYVNYAQTDHATFRYERCRDEYVQCLENLNTCRENAAPVDQTPAADTFIYILLRLTGFTRDAGYEELAIAIWQAVLEYLLFAPDAVRGRSKLDAFEDFWRSDVPRIGEDGAAGWATHASGGSSIARKRSSPTRPTFDPPRLFASFARAESSMANTFVVPAATADEHDESDDPFRYVVFPDIKPILERLPEDLNSKALIDGFLCFINLPPIDQQNRLSQEWPSDPYVQSGAGIRDPSKSTAQRHDSFSLFHRGFQDCLSNGAGDFVYRTLSTLVTAAPEYEELGEYLLAFLYHASPNETTKTAKRLLKSRPTSLRYYNAYALTAVRTAGSTGEMENAQQIWTKALALSNSLSKDARDDTVLLWHSWVMTLITHGDDDAALRILLTMPDGSAAALEDSPTSISAGSVLRAKRHLEESLDSMYLKRKLEHMALYGDCLAWLHYLRTSYDVNAALQSFATASSRLRKDEDKHALELTHQAKARLLGRHMTANRPFKPALFRDELVESRRLFPENSAILEHYYEVAERTRLDDRLRDAMSEASTTSAPPPVGLVRSGFAIDAEIARCSVDGASATKESVRALFRRALLTPDSIVKHSSLLWKRWLHFEGAPLQSSAGTGPSQRQSAVRNAKQVFSDGLRFLPWNKRWVVDGMAFFAASSEMGEEELRQVHDILVQRELRVRVDVSELIRTA